MSPEYAAAVAARYPWIRHYTPVNEIYVTARLSAKEGLWNEQSRTDRGFVTALKNLVGRQHSRRRTRSPGSNPTR